MKKYYVEIANSEDKYVLQSRWFKTREAAIKWARGIAYLDRNDHIYLMSANFVKDDEYQDIYCEENIRDEIYNG